MTSQTNEQAFEALIEKALTGSSKEERAVALPSVAEAGVLFGPGAGYEAGHPGDYDPALAIDRRLFWTFLDRTQPDEIAKLQRRPDWRLVVEDRLDRQIKRHGVIKVLKEGLAIDDAHFTLYYSLPINDLNPQIARRFEQNIFSVTRQVHFSPTDPAPSMDMVLFLNGLAVATLELKNAWTGQSAFHARQQYGRRNPKEPLFQFGRCVVHFAVDTDEVFMTTRLAGKETVFLPFNKGENFGKDNPVNPGGHRSAYLWEEVLTRHSLANILEHFVTLIGKRRTDKLAQRTLFFPRYHQLDVVRKLVADVARNGPGRTYLIQHSAGSGKSHSITWTAYQLIEVQPPGADRPVFDSVVVVTDRIALDKQLTRHIASFSEVQNIVAHADNSGDLKRHLEAGKRIIITTIQKFPHIVKGIEDLSDRTFGVIIDEAHSSQSGVAHDNLNLTLGGGTGGAENGDDEADADSPVDVQDLILRGMEGRKLGKNASFFAFTATPKNITLEKFGEQDAEGKFHPFHLYSMKQAIEESFILDVLANYTTYHSYYQIEKSIIENPLFESVQAQKKLRAYVEGHEQTIRAKAEIMVEHFLDQIVRPKKLKGQARGMVATRNIESAIRYFFAIREILHEKGDPFKVMVAFSGKKTVDGVECSEESLNGFPSKEMVDIFDGDDAKSSEDDYRLLVVANKFLTGFDQPKLAAMYVDKRLQGLMAVQALSRLNRSAAQLDKRTEDLFVLDFFNSAAEIKEAFDPFYTATSLNRATDVNVLHELKDALDSMGVYTWDEVTEFNERFFRNAPADQLSPIIDTCSQRFQFDLDLEEDEKADFKIKAKQFVKIYGQTAGLLPFQHLPWELLFWFLKFLIPKLPIHDPDQEALDALLESVDLATYGLERVKLNQRIGLDASATEVDPQNPNPRGVHGGDEAKDPLDEIVRIFNEHWFAGWDGTPAEQRVRFLAIAQHVAGQADYARQVVGNPDAQNRQLALDRLIGQAVSAKRKQDLDLYKRYASDGEFKQAFDGMILRILTQGLVGE